MTRNAGPLVLKVIIIIAGFQLSAEQTMPPPNCDVVKVAKDYARSRWPVDLTIDRRVAQWTEGNIRKVAFELPEDTFGYVPEIGIDEKTCQVVSAILWQ